MSWIKITILGLLCLAPSLVSSVQAQDVPRSSAVGIIVDEFEPPASEKCDAHNQLPMMLESSLDTVFENSPHIHIEFLEPGKYASILRSIRGYATQVPASTAAELATRAKANYAIFASYHRAVTQNLWSGGARIVDLKNGKVYPVGWVSFRPEDNDAFRELALELKEKIYQLQNVRARATRYTLAVCAPEFRTLQGPDDPELKGIVNTLIRDQLLSSVRKALILDVVKIEQQTRDCAAVTSGAPPGAATVTQLLMKVSVFLTTDASGQRKIMYHVNILYRETEIAAAPQNSCEPNAQKLVDAFNEAAVEVARELEANVADLPANTENMGGDK